jgi:hypothetical protein
MKNFIEYLDLPPLPAHLAEVADPLSYPRANTRAAYCERDGEVIPEADYRRFAVDSELAQWIVDNISPVYKDAGICFHGGSSSKTACPHSDRIRKVGLLYIIDPGGPEVDTVFWHEVNRPLHRETGALPSSYRDLTEVGRYRLAAGEWALIDTTVIHSVENIQGLRKTLHVDWMDPALAPYDKIIGTSGEDRTLSRTLIWR